MGDLRQRCREAGKRRSESLEFWYRRKYGLTARDARFLDVTAEEMLTDWWAHRYYDDPKLKDQVEDDEMTPEMIDRLANDEDAWEDVFKT